MKLDSIDSFIPSIKLLYSWIVSKKIENAELMFALLNCLIKCPPADSGPILFDMQRQYFKQMIRMPGLWTIYIHALLSLDENSMNTFKRLCGQMIKNAKMTLSWKSLIKKHSVYLIAWCIWKLLKNEGQDRDTLEHCIKSLGELCKKHRPNSSDIDWIHLQLYNADARILLEHLLGLVRQRNEKLDKKKSIVFGNRTRQFKRKTLSK